VLICDGLRTHEILEILKYCFENNIIQCRLPSHTSHKLQPCDIAVFDPLEAAYRKQVERLERGGENTIGKSISPLYSALQGKERSRLRTSRPVSLQVVCSLSIQTEYSEICRSPPTGLTIPKANKVKVGPCPQDEVLQTPVTPVLAETLMSLQNLTINQDAYALDEASKQSLQRHLQMFANATQKSFAKGVLHQDQIRFLITINNEAKVRRSIDQVSGTGEGEGHEL
jgi:hypothetical protein